MIGFIMGGKPISVDVTNGRIEAPDKYKYEIIVDHPK